MKWASAGFVVLAAAGSLCITVHGDSESGAQTGSIQGKVVSPWIRQSQAVVYVTEPAGKFDPPEKEPVLDQRDMLFLPHVLPVLVHSTVAFPNNDTVQHNVYSMPPTARQFNLGIYGAGESRRVTFDRTGVVPLLCNMHSEMSAFILVLPNPFFAVTDKQGTYTIRNVPAGTYTLAVWHEKLNPQTARVVVKAGDTADVTFQDFKKVPFYSVELARPESK